MMREFLIAVGVSAFVAVHAVPAMGQTAPGGKVSVSLQSDSILAVKGLNMSGKWLTVMEIICGPVTEATESGHHMVDYRMVTGKRSRCVNRYSEASYRLASGDSLHMRVYDDGVAWAGCSGYRIAVPDASHSWLMKWTDSYEEFYTRDREDLVNGMRIGYPSLFEFGDKSLFMLLSESGVNENSAASSLYVGDLPGSFLIKPDGKEMPGWQTAVIGSIADVVESTLINDNSEPSRLTDTSWIKPGVASWVYWAYNHGSSDYDTVCRYIDMAWRMKLPYVLIDAEWDEMKGDHEVLDAVKYAREKGIKPLIWYNSSVGWTDGAPGPKFRLNDPADREKEFEWCRANGIAGVKIDFFSGDTNANLRYMADLLECAARHGLMVNFHGATVPRGFQRTYPNLMSVEGVYGAEWYNNVPTFTDKAASHNATLPFTRNVIGSMDYTPCAFTDSQHPHITTDTHELALTVLYESGIQHLADRPESFLAQPAFVRDFLSELPAAWDETLLLGGYPGEYAVTARRKGERWYIAGINGSDSACEVRLDLTRLPDTESRKVVTISDGVSGWERSERLGVPQNVGLEPRGGFVMILD